VICHDDKSLEKARILCQHWETKISTDQASSEISFRTKIVKLNPSPFMESSIYPILKHNFLKDWENEDYVGIVTYSVLDKLSKFKKQRIDIDWMTIVKQATEHNVDVIGIFCLEFKRGQDSDLSLIESAVFHHGLNFYRAWRALLLELGYTEEMIDENTDKAGFFCNWTLSKPEFLKEYIDFVEKAMHIVNTNPKINELFFKNSHYGKGNTTDEQKMALFGRNYYTVHPFIFERILSFYLYYRKGIRVGSINRMLMRI